jgi:hypothetical protein
MDVFVQKMNKCYPNVAHKVSHSWLGGHLQ